MASCAANPHTPFQCASVAAHPGSAAMRSHRAEREERSVASAGPVSGSGFPAELFDSIANARNAGEVVTVSTDLQKGSSRISAESGETFFENPYHPSRRLLLVGAGAIALSLSANRAQI